MNKLLVICGPTSTGKTTLAIRIAKNLVGHGHERMVTGVESRAEGEIVSADSRQVYKGMDIGTGKDLPKGARLIKGLFASYGYYEIDGVKIWGYDLADPRQEFSVAQYLRIARKMIDGIDKRKRLPILVGGTGLYIKAVIDGIPTAEVPRNEGLRKNLEERSVSELFEKLSELDSIKAGSLNTSDRKNPRRLIRAIEIAQYQLTKKSVPAHHAIGGAFDVLYIGLSAPKDFLDRKIEKRVDARLIAGIKSEVRKLLRMGVKWEDQSMNALGYGEWRDFFEGAVDEEHVVSEWSKSEKNYAKRQTTWFKKDKRIKWFDITQKGYAERVEKLVEKWYHQGENVQKN